MDVRKSSEANYGDALFPGFAFRPKTGEQSFELFIWSNILFIVCCCSEEYFVIPDFWQRKSFQSGARYSCPDSSWFPLHPEVMQWIGWDSAKECLRGSACILSSSPLTFWSWHGACESFCPSAVFPVTMPKTFYFPSSDPCTWCINAVFDVALLPGSRKWCYSRTFRRHLCSTTGRGFPSQDAFQHLPSSKDQLYLLPLLKEQFPVQNPGVCNTCGSKAMSCPQNALGAFCHRDICLS